MEMDNNFHYKDNNFYVEDVSVETIVSGVGTPSYIYSYSSFVNSFQDYKEAFSKLDPLICFSVKANSNIAILRIFSKLGSGFDIVSEGELERVIRAGGDTSKVVFSGVGKTEEEMRRAMQVDILFFNVESREELVVLNQVASDIGGKARVAIRVNPDIDPKTHPYISTGFEKSKFGIDIAQSLDVYKEASQMKGIDVIGIDAHIGSQIFELSSFTDSLKKLLKLAKDLEHIGVDIKYIDIGGGLGISYKKDEIPPTKATYAEEIIGLLDEMPYKLILEPGRSLAGNSGILVTRVLYNKVGTAKKFIIVDAAMNDLVRPAFYESYHEILTAKKEEVGSEKVDVVGPICESGDFLAIDRELPKVKRGDLLVALSAGAYGYVMSSNYNTRPRVPEVLVNGSEYYVIKDREKIDDLIKNEEIPEFLSL